MIFILYHLLLCLAVAARTCDASIFNTRQYGLWCSENQTPPNSSYNTNLKKLLSYLSSNATKQDRYYSTNTTAIYGATNSETIYGLFECRGDTTLDQCKRCVNKAVSNLPPKECPSDKRVMMWYYSFMDCSIRYSNEPIQGILEERIHLGVQNSVNYRSVTNNVEGQGFMRLVDDTLHELANMSSLSGTRINKYLKTNNERVYKNLRLYTMAQCTPTLSVRDCEVCLGGVINELWACCNGSIGGRAVSPGCYSRFEVYPFYKPMSSTSPHLTIGYSQRRKKELLLGSLLGAFATSALLFILLLFGIRHYTRKRTSNIYDGELDEIRSTLDSLQYDFNTIKTATCKFSADNKVGQGGFGEVYKGKLKSGQEIAVKRLSKNTGQGFEQFKNEVVVVANLQHNNLVKLLGYCLSSKELMLVYEFLPNSSLDRFLFDQSKKAILDWDTRFKIIVGIARGLLYLHEDSRLKVIHRDLKSSNILLDEHMNPKISDFGLAKHFGVDQTQGDTMRIAGTYGYMAPEYAITGRYSSKSDVYSFGVITLEILSGRRNSFFVAESPPEEELLPSAWRLWKEGKAFDLVDAALKNNFAKEEVLKCFHIGLLCIQENANERPTMTSIVAALNGQTIDFPMPKPSLYVGSIANVKTIDRSESSSKYTGFQTITELYPRE